MPNPSGLSAGVEALAAGQWARARDAFEAELARGPSAVALDGLGDALWWLGEPKRSVELREHAYVLFRRGGELGRAIASALGVAVTYQANFDNTAAAHGWVARAGRLLAADDPFAGWVTMVRAYVSADLALAGRLARESLGAARAAGDLDLELCSLGVLGEKLVAAGAVEEGMACIDEAMAGTLGGECTRLETVAYTSCDMLVACDLAGDIARAQQWCRVADRFIAQYGCPFLSVRCRTLYGSLLVASGQWVAGERELLAAIDLCDGAGPAASTEAFARLSELRLRQGQVEDAAALLHGREDEVRAATAAAALRLARGDAAGAITLLQRRLAQAADGHVEAAPVLALLVRARIAAGELPEARDAAARLAALTGDLPVALAAVSTAAVSSAARADDAVAQLETGIALFGRLGMPHEAARARLDLAHALATARPDAAVAEAESALAVFARFGATLDADAAAALLRRLGVTPRTGGRRPGELTGRERQVLALVELGLSNPEIAARLHISRKTASHHVSAVLAKLGVRNRTEAAGLRFNSAPGGRN